MPKYFLFLLLLNAQFLLAQIDPANITIVRDTFGTPHVFAPTDAEVAYGFAWVSAEDDFKTMQAQLLPIKGLNGLVNGKQGAIFDVAVHLLDPHTVVETSYEAEVPADFKKVLNGYVEGVNAYAASHPKEVLHKKLFPIGPKDILKAYVVGHTDATGDFAYNMDLSQRRAASVTKALEGNGISSDRNLPAGVGLLAPVGSNSTEEGRQANRRMEMVAR